MKDQQYYSEEERVAYAKVEASMQRLIARVGDSQHSFDGGIRFGRFFSRIAGRGGVSCMFLTTMEIISFRVAFLTCGVNAGNGNCAQENIASRTRIHSLFITTGRIQQQSRMPSTGLTMLNETGLECIAAWNVTGPGVFEKVVLLVRLWSDMSHNFQNNVNWLETKLLSISANLLKSTIMPERTTNVSLLMK